MDLYQETKVMRYSNFQQNTEAFICTLDAYYVPYGIYGVSNKIAVSLEKPIYLVLSLPVKLDGYLVIYKPLEHSLTKIRTYQSRKYFL